MSDAGAIFRHLGGMVVAEGEVFEGPDGRRLRLAQIDPERRGVRLIDLATGLEEWVPLLSAPPPPGEDSDEDLPVAPGLRMTQMLGNAVAFGHDESTWIREGETVTTPEGREYRLEHIHGRARRAVVVDPTTGERFKVVLDR